MATPKFHQASELQDERLKQTLLYQAQNVECRASIDLDGSLVVTWWDATPKGWECDQGAKVPRQGLTLLTEFLLEKL